MTETNADELVWQNGGATPVNAPVGSVSHGHVRPRPDGLRARCGGPAICEKCYHELSALVARREATEDEQKQFGEFAVKFESAVNPEPTDAIIPPQILDKTTVHVNVATPTVHISEGSAVFLLQALDAVSFKGSEAKLAAGIAQQELERELKRLHPPTPPNRAERRARPGDGTGALN